MARQTIVRLRDDIDGGEAAETVQFTWAGTAYEIDLNKKNAEAFAEAVAPYVRAARRTGSGSRTRGSARRSSRSTRSARSDVSAIRAWALENGYAVSSRGRLPSNVIAAFEAAQSASAGAADGSSPAAKAPARKATARKSTARKSTARKAGARTSTARTSTARKSTARKANARKAAPKK